MKTTFALLLLFVLPVWAQGQTVRVEVNGLVCDFCARALEKVFDRLDEVAGIEVDLDSALVVVRFNEGRSLDDDSLTEYINDSGYGVVAIHR